MGLLLPLTCLPLSYAGVTASGPNASSRVLATPNKGAQSTVVIPVTVVLAEPKADFVDDLAKANDIFSRGGISFGVAGVVDASELPRHILTATDIKAVVAGAKAKARRKVIVLVYVRDIEIIGRCRIRHDVPTLWNYR